MQVVGVSILLIDLCFHGNASQLEYEKVKVSIFHPFSRSTKMLCAEHLAAVCLWILKLQPLAYDIYKKERRENVNEPLSFSQKCVATVMRPGFLPCMLPLPSPRNLFSLIITIQVFGFTVLFACALLSLRLFKAPLLHLDSSGLRLICALQLLLSSLFKDL